MRTLFDDIERPYPDAVVGDRWRNPVTRSIYRVIHAPEVRRPVTPASQLDRFIVRCQRTRRLLRWRRFMFELLERV